MKKLNDINCKMNNLVRRYTEKFYRDDLLLDKDYILNNGTGRYYFIVRNTGTVCFSENDYINNPDAKATYDFYLNESSNCSTPINFYVIDVINFENGTPYGTIKKVNNF